MKMFLKISMLFLVFALFTGAGLNAQTNSLLNGRWAVIEDGVEVIYDMNNGIFENLINDASMGVMSICKGTYTTTDKEIIFIIELVNGGVFSLLFDQLGIPTGIESKWYTMTELVNAILPVFGGLGFSESDVSDMVASITKEDTATAKYTLNANTLILTTLVDGKETVTTFNKK